MSKAEVEPKEKWSKFKKFGAIFAGALVVAHTVLVVSEGDAEHRYVEQFIENGGCLSDGPYDITGYSFYDNDIAIPYVSEEGINIRPANGSEGPRLNFNLVDMNQVFPYVEHGRLEPADQPTTEYISSLGSCREN